MVRNYQISSLSILQSENPSKTPLLTLQKIAGARAQSGIIWAKSEDVH